MPEVTEHRTASIKALQTPALLLSVERVQRNIARLRSHLLSLGVPRNAFVNALHDAAESISR
jgi:D-serine deaminase-like pyridoxal phosphate-dependent protein